MRKIASSKQLIHKLKEEEEDMENYSKNISHNNNHYMWPVGLKLNHSHNPKPFNSVECLRTSSFDIANNNEFSFDTNNDNDSVATYHYEIPSNNCVVFEKVNYKENIRYYHNTPYSSSLDIYTNASNNTENPNNNQAENLQESKEENDHQWDINGNSMENEQMDSNNYDNYEYSEEELDNDSLDSQRSSLLSSCTTLDTWLEDEFIEITNHRNRSLSQQYQLCLMNA